MHQGLFPPSFDPWFLSYICRDMKQHLEDSHAQGLVGQLFFAPHGYLEPSPHGFSWSLRILFLDGALGTRCCYTGASQALSAGELSSLVDLSKRLLGLFKNRLGGFQECSKRSRGELRTSRNPRISLLQHLFGLGSLWLSLIHHPHLIGGGPVV